MLWQTPPGHKVSLHIAGDTLHGLQLPTAASLGPEFAKPAKHLHGRLRGAMAAVNLEQQRSGTAHL